jgi:DNA helicase-2/ATP-dependent DNA helicase PcrA
VTEAPHLAQLNAEQREAVTTLEGPLLILAGAGSGKTNVLTKRIAHLLHSGVAAENILAVTFTNKAAREMKERVAEVAGPAADKVWVSTFHSSCGRILRADIEPLGWTRRFTIYDDDDQLRVVRQILADRGVDPKDVAPSQILSAIDHHKNRLLTPEDLIRSHRGRSGDLLYEVWTEYEQSLRTADAVDFNDLIGHTVRLFRDHSDILQKWRDRFHYLLVDEYQDTNRAQYLLLQMLAEERRNLCCVGDDDQSIYGFRGADINNILDFKRDYPNATVVRLERNYRCSKNILDVANAVVARNSGRIDKKLWTVAGPGPLVNVLVAEEPDAEARLVTAAISQLRRQGFRYRDMALLYRSNRTARTFQRALERAGVPCDVVGGRAWTERREIRDLLGWLRLLVSPSDDASFLRICNVPPRGIGTITLTLLRQEATERGEPLLATARGFARSTKTGSKAVDSFVRLVDDLASQARDYPAPSLIRAILEVSGYRAMLEAEGSREAEERIRNLDDLVHRAGEVEALSGIGRLEKLQAWLDLLALQGREDDDEATSPADDQGKVTLMTVHTSKGLEYPVIFVVHMMEGLFPHDRALEDAGGVEEERRLAYVAFTRAKQRLVITRSRRKPGIQPGEVGPIIGPSRFLHGLPPAVCAGDIPAIDPSLNGPSDTTSKETAERLRRFLENRRPAPAVEPDDALLTAPVHRGEQLQPGIWVLHPNLGRGIVRGRRGQGESARILVTFGDGRTVPVPLHPCPLKILLRPDPTAADPGDNAGA